MLDKEQNSILAIKDKGKFIPVHPMMTYIHGSQLHSFCTSAPYGGEWLTLRPGCFDSGKGPRYPWNRRLGGPKCRRERFGEVINLLSLPRFEPRTVQPVAHTISSPNSPDYFT
jgi:hypothetical protein